MRDIKQAFWIAGQNFYGWKKSPRIWMTFILAAILYPFDSGTSPYMEKHLLKITGIGEYRPFQ